MEKEDVDPSERGVSMNEQSNDNNPQMRNHEQPVQQERLDIAKIAAQVIIDFRGRRGAGGNVYAGLLSFQRHHCPEMQ